MAEHRGDRLEPHPTVDRLGREGVAQLVWVDVTEPGSPADLAHDPSDLVAVDVGAVAVQQPTGQRWVRRSPVGEQTGGVGVQGDVAVVVQLADRDPQPWGAVEHDDGVTGERAELPDTHSGA